MPIDYPLIVGETEQEKIDRRKHPGTRMNARQLNDALAYYRINRNRGGRVNKAYKSPLK